MSKRGRMRALLAADQTIVAPGVYDALTARLVERAGFDAVFVSGAAVAASLLAVPDVGLVTMSEALVQTRNIVESVALPVVADCDTGYGNPLNVQRTVQQFESAGVAALFIEDQVSPKRCGHFEDKDVIPSSEMIQKVRAAVDARRDPELLIIARTDATAVYGLADALRRCEAYVEAGADALFVEAPNSLEELAHIPRALRVLDRPLMVNLVEGGRTPLVSVSDLTEMGYRLVTFSGSVQKTAIRAIEGLLEELFASGEVRNHYPARMVSLQERSDILGLPEYLQRERRYEA